MRAHDDSAMSAASRQELRIEQCDPIEEAHVRRHLHGPDEARPNRRMGFEGARPDGWGGGQVDEKVCENILHYLAAEFVFERTVRDMQLVSLEV